MNRIDTRKCSAVSRFVSSASMRSSLLWCARLASQRTAARSAVTIIRHGWAAARQKVLGGGKSDLSRFSDRTRVRISEMTRCDRDAFCYFILLCWISPIYGRAPFVRGRHVAFHSIHRGDVSLKRVLARRSNQSHLRKRRTPVFSARCFERFAAC
jgi:hypothetical protein